MLVHQLWLQGKHRAPISEQELRVLPWGIRHQLWDEEMVTKLVEEKYPEWLSFWLRLPHLMIRCDVARAFILHAFGGVYADLDYEPSQSFAEIWELRSPHVLVGRYQRLLPTYRIPNNAWIFSPKGHPFWLDVFLPEVRRELETPSFLTTLGQMMMGNWWLVLCAAGPVAWARWVARGEAKALEYEQVYQTWGIHAKKKTGGWVPWGELSRHLAIFISMLLLCLILVL